MIMRVRIRKNTVTTVCQAIATWAATGTITAMVHTNVLEILAGVTTASSDTRCIKWPQETSREYLKPSAGHDNVIQQ